MGQDSTSRFDLVIVGGGAAGLMAACQAPQGLRIAVCEHLPEAGRKLLATGGGRCNFTTAMDSGALPALFGRQGRFIVPALRAMPPQGLRDWFARIGVPSVVEEGRFVFPESHCAADVRDALLAQARKRGATVLLGTKAESLLLRETGRDGGNRISRAVAGVRTSRGVLRAPHVLLATGGCSMPALGSDGSGYALAREAGHTTSPPLPALVPLRAADDWAKKLPGVSLEEALLRFEPPAGCSPALRRAGTREEYGPVLFTHHGLSGPAALNLSGIVAAALEEQAGQPSPGIRVILRPIAGRDERSWQRQLATWRAEGGRRSVRNLLSGVLPRAVATTLCSLAEVPDVALAQTPGKALARLAGYCGGTPLAISGTDGWNHSMVTRGGVTLPEIDPATLRSKLADGLSFAGEVVDLDAPCGGFNLTWAFASATLAARSVASA
ncbi:MAG: NAD(P)/FAD-dependent oxidoreductase [Kiritimatiellia bacterium]|jgi:predicted Rossmann fold flavoprotein